MTPKEKAQELFENMYYKIESDELGKDEESAKECALIAVDEIIDEYQKIFPNVNRRNYWDEVKQEIENL
jgi:hypothetical protein